MCKCGYENLPPAELEDCLGINDSGQGQTSLKHLIKLSLAEEPEDYRCDGCHKKGQVKVTHQLTKLPTILVIHVRRFAYSGQTKKTGKTENQIELSTVLKSGDLLPDEAKGKKVKAKGVEQKATYNLCSVVQHSGSLKKGHYVCFSKSPQDSWTKFDDTNVRSASPTEAMENNENECGDKFTPYVLFYAKVRPKSEEGGTT